MKKSVLMIIVALMVSQSTIADVCDYTPSNFLGGKGSAAVGGAALATATAGVGMKSAGLYAITHTAGATMLGSTAIGVSAAGTTGIIAGTGGVLGSIGAALISPFVIIPATVVAVGVGAYEGGCYLAK